MKLDEMKVQYDRTRDGFTKESDFAVRSERKLPKININGIAVKVGLCAGVLALAFIVRAFGVGAPKDQTVEVSSRSEGTEENEKKDVPGSLKYVDTSHAKWTAPVRSNDIELMLEGRMLRFTAGGTAVSSCMDGKVHSVGTDATYGNFVRVQSDADCEAVYYGLDTVDVKEGETVRTGEAIGTVTVGHSMYLRVYEQGSPVDPTSYVDLSLRHE
jgi:biotin carboxyl carrier protein